MISVFARNELSTAQIRVLLDKGYKPKRNVLNWYELEKETTDEEEDNILFSQAFGYDGSKHLDWFIVETKSGMLHRLPAESAQDAVFRHNLYYSGVEKAEYIGAAPKLSILEESIPKIKIFVQLREKSVVKLSEYAPYFQWDKEKIRVEED
jgi:hypothetical protein